MFVCVYVCVYLATFLKQIDGMCLNRACNELEIIVSTSCEYVVPVRDCRTNYNKKMFKICRPIVTST